MHGSVDTEPNHNVSVAFSKICRAPRSGACASVVRREQPFPGDTCDRRDTAVPVPPFHRPIIVLGLARFMTP